MTRYRFRGIFLLLLMGHATACATSSWQSPGLTATPDRGVSVADYADYIQEMQPGQVRITLEDGTQIEMEDPVVEDDEIVSTKRVGITNPQGSTEWTEGLSVPIADIAQVDAQEIPHLLYLPVIAGMVWLGTLLDDWLSKPCGPLDYGGWGDGCD